MDELFSVGTLLFAEYRDRQGVAKSFRTHVYERAPECLTILAPAERGILVSIRPTTPLVLRQICDERAYLAEVLVTDEYPQDPALITTTLPQEAETVCRRSFFRVGTELEYCAEAVRGTILDLSGSGLLARVPPHSYAPGDKVTVALQLPASPPFNVQGRVVRVTVQGDHEEAAVMFTRLGDGWRDRIVSHVLHCQSQRLRYQRQPDEPPPPAPEGDDVEPPSASGDQ